MGLFDFGYKRRLWFSLQDNYGRRPDPFYAAGDMSTIRSYHDYMREQEPDVFHIDDVTWSDLDMDRVFKRINPGLSTPGEQVLYHLLRTPAMDSAEYERRTQLIRFAEADEQERLETQYVLGCLGRFRRADVCRVFSPSYGGYLGIALYMILALALLCSPLSMIALGVKGLLITLALFALNVMLHEWNTRHSQAEIETVNFSVSMALALKKLKNLGFSRLDECIGDSYRHLQALRPLMALGAVPSRSSDMTADFISSALLLDLIMFEYLKTAWESCTRRSWPCSTPWDAWMRLSPRPRGGRACRSGARLSWTSAQGRGI